jgi:hypothetical protein
LKEIILVSFGVVRRGVVMQAKLALLWTSLMALMVLPGLACSLAWALAAQPGPPRGLALPLMPGRTLEVDLQSCASVEPGRVTVWFVDTTNANRFVREHFVLLLRSVAAPPCP